MNYIIMNDTGIDTFEQLREEVSRAVGCTLEEAAREVYAGCLAHNSWLAGLDEVNYMPHIWGNLELSYNTICEEDLEKLIQSLQDSVGTRS